MSQVDELGWVEESVGKEWHLRGSRHKVTVKYDEGSSSSAKPVEPRGTDHYN